MHLAHENGHVTYDDINDILPDGLSPDDLDELYTKLRSLDIEMLPPLNSTFRFAMGSPRPVPAAFVGK